MTRLKKRSGYGYGQMIHRRRRSRSCMVLIPTKSSTHTVPEINNMQPRTERLNLPDSSQEPALAISPQTPRRQKNISLLTPPSTRHTLKEVVRNRSSTPLTYVATQLRHKNNTPHKWTFEERVALCLLKRMYTVDAIAIAKILNTIFSYDSRGAIFRPGAITSMYSNIKRGFSTLESQIAYATVWSCRFDELQTKFAAYVDEFEITAQARETGLESRRGDNHSALRYSKLRKLQHPQLSKSAKSTFVEFVRPPPSLGSSDILRDDLGPVDLARNPSAAHVPLPASISSAVNEKSNSLDISAFFPKISPVILCRYYSEQSAGLNSAEMLKAGKYKYYPYPSLGHPSCNELLEDAAIHLHRQPQGTRLISTSPSIVWVVMKCFHATAVEKSLMLIDGYSARRESGVYHCKPLIRELKKQGMFNTGKIISGTDSTVTLAKSRYSGAFEYFVDGSVSKSSIIGTVPFQALQVLANRNSSVGDFLRFDLIKTSKNIGALRSKLSHDASMLNTQSAQAIATMALLFGISAYTTDAIISGFVYEMLQGWVVRLPTSRAVLQAAVVGFAETICKYSDVVLSSSKCSQVELAMKAAVDQYRRTKR